mmetsp:Transcript_30891/g.30383  ORF Transcript_30891/g.30383 Transcript_30891/m.30383 type:complete len:93 (+) Transcript_30891:60-338(+)
MVSQQIIQEKNNELEEDNDINDDIEEIYMEEEKHYDPEVDSIKKEEAQKKKGMTFDPDGDGFNFEYEKAYALHKNMNILQFIRKSLLLNNCK